ncbi:hypothetical protein O4444_10795 [Xylella fastidiosa subsp. pauca]|nr:hypothetical protein [Xylella fastidiosa]ETE29559.1 hypothetical protein B398_11775 [Xylella fastidiosa 32]MDG5823053.1 hypothetical protein [Xylella fastidiosa subsp. pauca]WGZ31953.1 hypothetical protein O4444_10795 [Xylella fastidiosa subsp. pauca]
MRKRAWAVVALSQCRLTRAQAGLASCEKALELYWWLYKELYNAVDDAM